MRFASIRLVSLLLVFVLAMTVGCKAQNAAASGSDSSLARTIEIMVRSKFSVPAEYSVTLGTRQPSNIPGYDRLPVTLAHNARSTAIDFLISKDNKTLARLDTFDLTHLPELDIPVDHRPVRGNPNAKVTVISFDDLECGYCARMHQELFPQTLERYKDLVRFVYKDDPLIEIHPWALHAAINANCLADQNGSAYWGYVDYLHTHGQDVTGSDRDPKKSNEVLDRIAIEQGKIFALDAGKLTSCLQKQDETTVRASMKEADSLGVEGTPYLFIDGEHINGALPTEQVWAVIDRALKANGVTPPPMPSNTPAPSPTLGR